MIERLMKKHALTEQGAKDFIKSTISCTTTDLILMIPVGLLYLYIGYYRETERGTAFPQGDCQYYTSPE